MSRRPVRNNGGQSARSTTHWTDKFDLHDGIDRVKDPGDNRRAIKGLCLQPATDAASRKVTKGIGRVAAAPLATVARFLLLLTLATPARAAEPPSACEAGASLTGRIAAIEPGVGSAVPVLHLSPKTGPLPTGIRLAGLIFPAIAGDEGRSRLIQAGAALAGTEVVVHIPPMSRLDRYGRLPGVVGLPSGETLQQHLLAAGLGLASGENATCWNDFVTSEAEARRERHGIWNRSALITAVRDIQSLPDFVLLRGRVASIGRAGRSVYLNLGPDRLSGPTVRLTARAIDALTARGVDADGLVGRKVEARGWATNNRGLQLTLDDGAVGLVEIDKN